MDFFAEFPGRLEKMVNMLDAEDGVVVEEFSIRPPLPVEGIEKVVASAKEEGIEVPGDVLSFYSVCNGFTLKWNLKKMKEELDTEVVGTANVLPMEKVFSDWDGFLYFSDEPEINERDGYDLTKAKVFDAFIAEAGVLLYFGERPGYEVLYHYYGEEVLPTGWSLKGYLDNLLRMKALWYWQPALIEAEGDVLKALGESDLYPDFEALGLDSLVRSLLLKEV